MKNNIVERLIYLKGGSSPDQVIKMLGKHFNYDYPKEIKMVKNKILVSKNSSFLKYSVNQFKLMYEGIIKYIHTYISWLNLFCYDFFSDMKFIDNSKNNNLITDINYIKKEIFKYCGNIECDEYQDKLSKIINNNNKKKNNIVNALQLFKYMIENIKNDSDVNTVNNFCILTKDFIENVKIYFDNIDKFKSAYFKSDFSKYKKKKIKLKGIHNKNLNTFANFLLNKINILFEFKLNESKYTTLNNMNKFKSKSNNENSRISNSINKNLILDIIRTSNTRNKVIYSTRLFHSAIDELIKDLGNDPDNEKVNETNKKITNIIDKLKKKKKGKKFEIYKVIISDDKKFVKLKEGNDKYTIDGGEIKEEDYVKELKKKSEGYYIVQNYITRIYYEVVDKDDNGNGKVWIKISDLLNKKELKKKINSDSLKYIKAVRNKRLKYDRENNILENIHTLFNTAEY